MAATDSTAQKLTALFDTPEPAELGPGPRTGVSGEQELERKLQEIFLSNVLPKENQQLLRALVLLWHDHFETAHSISQDIANADGAFVHGILHRREPDYGNAAYWFRRVGQHPAFPVIAERAQKPMEKEKQLQKELTPGGTWNPFGFIDACEKANRPGAASEDKDLLREIQQIESHALLELFCKPAG